MADGMQRLLKYIVTHYTAPEELKEIERDTASGVHDSIQDGQRRVMREEEERVDQLAASFAAGLRRAHNARSAGGNAISLDDRSPDDNQIADALVHFLVGPGIASSTSRETERHQYIYTIYVDWSKLYRIAHAANVDLDEILTQ